MRRIALGLLLVSAAVLIPATPSLASWVSTHCYTDNHADSSLKRSAARAYGSVAISEGYEYGGGCWNDNNVDDTPNAPDSGGEGPDCSGLVFKSWELENSWGKSGFRWWNKMENVHGPYSSTAYHDAGTQTSLPFFHVGKSNALYMDAFARDGHVGLFYSAVPTSSGTYRFLEAKGDAYGTAVFEENWMGDSGYVGVRRKDWTPDCAPNCTSATELVAVLDR